jgi:mitochondrial fission protein ELM1
MTLTHIRVISDSRPGHENQSIGLAEALRLRTGAAVEVVRFPANAGFWGKRSLACAVAAGGGIPQLVIGAGHGTHFPLVAAARKFGAKSVVIMRPSLPAWCFDLCLVPRHDLANPRDAGRVVTTRGALNRIAETPAVKTDTGVILIGGPSSHHTWDGAPLRAAIREIVQARPELAWTVGDSRRTPEGFINQLKECGAALMPHQQTQPGWLPTTLGAAREVWVTEDSVSMIFEALTAGARVGLLPMPVKNPAARTVKAVNDLLTDGYVRTLAEWRLKPQTEGVTPVLHETARCAEVVLDRFFR